MAAAGLRLAQSAPTAGPFHRDHRVNEFQCQRDGKLMASHLLSGTTEPHTHVPEQQREHADSTNMPVSRIECSAG